MTDDKPQICRAPFTPTQLTNITSFQHCDFVHQLTCPGPDCRSEILRAQTSGLICPECFYMQSFVPSFVADGSFEKAARESWVKLMAGGVASGAAKPQDAKATQQRKNIMEDIGEKALAVVTSGNFAIGVVVALLLTWII